MISKYSVFARIIDIRDGEFVVLFVLNAEDPNREDPQGKSFVKPRGWGLPGGRVKAKDRGDYLSAIRREISGETGLEKVTFQEIENAKRIDQGNRLRITITGWNPIGELQPSAQDVLAARWFTEKEIRRGKFLGNPIYYYHGADALEVFETLKRMDDKEIGA